MIEINAGDRFGRWTVVSGDRASGMKVLGCRCECGTERDVDINNLVTGISQSCGCARREKLYTLGGASAHHLYKRWESMIARCCNPSNHNYRRYGARGISVYPEWLRSPAGFYEYIESLPGYGGTALTVDRINNDGDYEPGNLRWASPSDQARNTRTTALTELKVRVARRLKPRFSYADLADMLEVNKGTLRDAIIGRTWANVDSSQPLPGQGVA